MVNKRALKYSWKITDEVNPLLISKNRTLLHSHRHPCQLCLPACLSKIIGRVSTASCLFIWFPEGDGCLPMPYCLEIPPRHLYSSAPPSGHNASGRCWLEVSHCALPREQKQPHSCERGKAFPAPPPPPPEGGKVASQTRRSLTLWFIPFKDQVASLSLTCPSFSFKEGNKKWPSALLI